LGGAALQRCDKVDVDSALQFAENPDRFLVLKGRSFSCAAMSNPIRCGVKPHGNARGGREFFSANCDGLCAQADWQRCAAQSKTAEHAHYTFFT
jgi:hypothetical protein